MIKITMYSSADKVAGQGVGSAYAELMTLLKDRFASQFDIQINEFSRQNDISHYHTIDPVFLCRPFPRNGAKRSATCTSFPRRWKAA